MYPLGKIGYYFVFLDLYIGSVLLGENSLNSLASVRSGSRASRGLRKSKHF